MKSFGFSLAICCFLGACGGDGDVYPSMTISVYTYAGSVQCIGSGLSLSEMERQLTKAGIRVLSSACGTDGQAHAAICGGSDGRIGIFDIPSPQEQAAASLGFIPLGTLPSAVKSPC